MHRTAIGLGLYVIDRAAAVDKAGNASSWSAPQIARTPPCWQPVGQVLFNARVLPEVDAPVSLSDGSPPGPGFIAEFVLVRSDGAIQRLQPATAFRTNSTAAAHYVQPVTLSLPGTLPGDQVTLRMRVWRGQDYATADVRGESRISPSPWAED